MTVLSYTWEVVFSVGMGGGAATGSKEDPRGEQHLKPRKELGRKPVPG